MHFSLLNPGHKQAQNPSDITPGEKQEYNTMEGIEFLDDQIRMVEQPLMPHEHFEEMASECSSQGGITMRPTMMNTHYSTGNIHNYSSCEEALADLRKRGYTVDFTAEVETMCLYCGELDMRLDPTEFRVDELYRFDCNAGPDVNTTLYAISDPVSGVKGTLVDEPGID